MTISTIFKWTILVWLNAALSFILAVSDNTALIDIVAICLGVFTFVGIYAFADQYLINTGKTELSTQLLWSAVIKMLTQFAPMIEIFTGSMALEIVNSALGVKLPFISAYLTTLMDGFLLSLLVLMLVPLVRLVFNLFKKESL